MLDQKGDYKPLICTVSVKTLNESVFQVNPNTLLLTKKFFLVFAVQDLEDMGNLETFREKEKEINCNVQHKEAIVYFQPNICCGLATNQLGKLTPLTISLSNF